MGFAEEYEKISQSQSKTAAANFIHTEISGWRGTRRPIAARRWLWELLQNALDAAIINQKQLSLTIVYKPSELLIRHDAGPFGLAEIVALVEGNTSKYHRDPHLAGRFGRGFLVSHVISTEVRVRGVLKDRENHLYKFMFQISRGGEMEQIRNNILNCAKALNSSTPADEGPQETAFSYLFSPKDGSVFAIEEGLDQLKAHAPYLFAFLPQLKSIRVLKNSEPEINYERTAQDPIDDAPNSLVATRTIVNTPTGSKTIVAFTSQVKDAEQADHNIATIAFQLRQTEGKEVIVAATTQNVSKVFADLPLYATNELPNPVVINIPKNSDVDPDRAIPDLSQPSTFKAVSKAIRLLPVAFRWASGRGLTGVHLLAELGLPPQNQWEAIQGKSWQEIFQPVLVELMKSRLVATSDGKWSRPDEATFPKGEWLSPETFDRSLLLGVHELLEMRGEKTPSKELIEDWHQIILAWGTLGIRLDLKSKGLGDLLHEFARYDSLKELLGKYSKLRNDQGALDYVSAAFAHAAIYCQRNKISHPSELQETKAIPNQNGVFCLPEHLSVDRGIDNTLKSIASDLGASLKQRLVHERLTASGGKLLVAHLCESREITPKVAVAELVSRIEQKAQESLKGSDAEKVKRAAVRLLVWLAMNAQTATELSFSSFPLVCADKELHWVSELHDTFILPSDLIPADERQWLDLMPESVQLARDYLEECTSSSASLDAFRAFLTSKSIASGSLIYTKLVDLDSETVAALQVVRGDTSGHKVDSILMADVPGLTRLLSETAGAGSAPGGSTQIIRVLQFILSLVVENDASWEKASDATCAREHQCPGSLQLYPCLWLAKLKTKLWVSSGDGEKTREPLNSKNIKSLADQLATDTINSPRTREFLALHFGVDRLELSIRAAAGRDPAKERQLRNQWADMVDLATPSEFEDFISRRRLASATSSRNNKLGSLVETLAKLTFEEAGFRVERTGKGSDFRVFVPTGSNDNLESEEIGILTLHASLAGRNWEFLVEVKATTKESVSMSWEQGKQAALRKENYILCVIDFSKNPQQLDQVLSAGEQDPAMIRELTGLVPDIGGSLVESVNGLENAVLSKETGIEVERTEELRFRVHRGVWAAGLSFKDWAEAVRSGTH
jgi:hypothetical protein